MVKQISQELMMIMLVIAPLLCGIFFRIGVPLLETNLLARYGLENCLAAYYDLFSWLLAIVTGMLFAFVGGLVVLEEIDEHVAKYIIVTPAGLGGYVTSRILLPAFISGVAAAVLIPVFALTPVTPELLVVMVVSTVLSGIVTALLVVAISSNKVEGMAVGKISGLFGATFFLPLFVKGSIRYVFWIFPMYHIGRWSMEGGTVQLVISVVLYFVWILVLFLRLKKKFS